ncbi:Calcium-transporting ATPase 3, endoplasmic reticulum-type [Camellia lanceoleosa]|nr:Calcium-transporting ATPase 3, endoplasmic reticulum-type [Camellia lanceoleosa]
MLLHILILYVRPLSILFSVTPLSWAEWTVVLYLSFPAKKPGKATIKVVSNFDPFNYDENEDGTKVEYRVWNPSR